MVGMWGFCYSQPLPPCHSQVLSVGSVPMGNVASGITFAWPATRSRITASVALKTWKTSALPEPRSDGLMDWGKPWPHSPCNKGSFLWTSLSWRTPTAGFHKISDSWGTFIFGLKWTLMHIARKKLPTPSGVCFCMQHWSDYASWLEKDQSKQWLIRDTMGYLLWGQFILLSLHWEWLTASVIPDAETFDAEQNYPPPPQSRLIVGKEDQSS